MTSVSTCRSRLLSARDGPVHAVSTSSTQRVIGTASGSKDTPSKGRKVDGGRDKNMSPYANMKTSVKQTTHFLCAGAPGSLSRTARRHCAVWRGLAYRGNLNVRRARDCFDSAFAAAAADKSLAMTNPRATSAVGPGFTMIEIMIVVVIILIAAVTAVPMMSSAATLQVRSAASMIAADIEYAKSMAISRGQYYSVIFDTGAESYQVQNQSGSVILHPVKKGFNYVVDFRNDSRLSKVDIVSVDFNSTSRVKFDYLGSPFDAGGAALNTGTITIHAGALTKTVTVEPVTGYVSVSN
jgi:prepilin-type N-terminal cleavage/methylation domain-containing protein